MHGLDVAFYPPRDAADRQRSRSRERADDLPAFAAHDAEQHFRRGEADAGALLVPLECVLSAAPDLGKGSDLQRYGLHLEPLQSSTSRQKSLSSRSGWLNV